MCRSTRRPLLCPNCVNRGHLNDLALRTARQHKQKLLERINRALEVQVETVALHLVLHLTNPRESRRGKVHLVQKQVGLLRFELAAVSHLLTKAILINDESTG